MCTGILHAAGLRPCQGSRDSAAGSDALRDYDLIDIAECDLELGRSAFVVSASQPGLSGKPANRCSDLYGVGMKQTTHVLTDLENQSELMAGAILHLRNAMESGSRRSCAVACMLFTCLAEDEALGSPLCEACKSLSECLEGLTDSLLGEVKPE